MTDYSFGDFIRELRTRRGLSQFQLGKLVGVSDKAVSKWESGLAKPRIGLCAQIADLFDISLDELLACKYHRAERPQKGVFAMKKALWQKAHDRMVEIYGSKPPIQMLSRFEAEREALYDTAFIVMADFFGRLTAMCSENYGDVFHRGSTEASFVAWLLGGTKLNPLPAHYRCPLCKKVEFTPEAACGFDLPEKMCACGTRMLREGINVPEKSLVLTLRRHMSFDVSIPGDLMEKSTSLLLDYFKDCYLLEGFYSGTSSANLIHRYAIVRHPEEIAGEWMGRIRPYELNTESRIDEFFAHPTITLIDSRPETMLHRLCRMTNRHPRRIDYLSEEVLACCRANAFPDSLKAKNSDGSLQMYFSDTKCFSDILRADGMFHSAIMNDAEHHSSDSNTVNIQKIDCFREDVYSRILRHTKAQDIGGDALATRIMEKAQIGRFHSRGLDAETEHILHALNLPPWYIDYLKRVGYLFPKSHAAAYEHTVLRLIWFWLTEPEAFHRVMA